MALNPYYQNPYQPMGYNGQYGNYAPQNAAGAPQAFVCQITRVNGRNGAEAFRMAPNSSILLMDENDPIVWMKQTDGAGYATVSGYPACGCKQSGRARKEIGGHNQWQIQ